VEIFAQDTERRQDFAEAVLTFEIMKETYSAYGYDLIELPRLPIPERVAFVLDRMRSHGAGPHHSTVTDLARLRG
jgi:predicted ATPase